VSAAPLVQQKLKLLSCRRNELEAAARMVSEGAVVVYPTDTVYGLGCDPSNRSAVERVFRLKGRGWRAAPILCYSEDEAFKLIDVDDRILKLARSFWPGPLTIVSKARAEDVAPILKSPDDRIGVRVPAHPCARILIQLCGGRLVGTSANRSGLPSPIDAQEVLARLGAGFDILVDGGRTPLGCESTVIDVLEGEIRFLREGCISRGSIMSLL